MSSFGIVSLVWIVSEIILGRVAKAAPGNNRDQSSLTIIWITIIVSISAGVMLKVFLIGSIIFYPEFVHLIGIILIAIGLLIRWIAIISLRKYFTVDVSVKDDQQLIKTGLYKVVRHPSYTGSLLSFLGLGIAFVNWLTIAIIFIPILFAFLNRISVEENVLTERFGEEYTSYCNETKKLIPGIY